MKLSNRIVAGVLALVVFCLIIHYRSEALSYWKGLENRAAGHEVSSLSFFSLNTMTTTIPTEKEITDTKEKEIADVPKEKKETDKLIPKEKASENKINLLANKVDKVDKVPVVSSKLIQPDWTSLKGNQGYVHHFYSAYYDGRSSEKLRRPAVIVMGYVEKIATEEHFHCLFIYSNGSSSCSSEPAHRRHVSECWQVTHKSFPFHYLCKVSGGEVPVSVKLSTSQQCEEETSTNEMPVGNREQLNTKPTKKFGVCVGGPLVQKENILADVVEFVEMSMAMGVELVVFYVHKAQIDKTVLEYIWEHYPNTVRTIGWGLFEKWDPFHYYGQLLMISDCFYRHMHEIEFISTLDVDEMILPAEEKNWEDMIKTFKNSDKAPEYMFQNAFFEPELKKPLTNCPDKPTPKYFTRMQRITCKPGYDYRTKLISRPKLIYEPSVHWSCAKVDGIDNTYRVPPAKGIVAHYRTEIPLECQHKPVKRDSLAKRFEEKVNKAICLS